MPFRPPENFSREALVTTVAFGAIIVDPAGENVFTGLESMTERWHRRKQLGYPIETWLTAAGANKVRRNIETRAETVLRRAIGYDRWFRVSDGHGGLRTVKRHVVGEEVDGIPLDHRVRSKYLVSVVYVPPSTAKAKVRVWMENYLFLAKKMVEPKTPSKRDLTSPAWRSFRDLLAPFSDSYPAGRSYFASDFSQLPPELAADLALYLNSKQSQISSREQTIYVGDVMRRPGVLQGLRHTRALLDRFDEEPDFKMAYLRNPETSGYQPPVEPLMFSPPADFFQVLP